MSRLPRSLLHRVMIAPVVVVAFGIGVPAGAQQRTDTAAPAVNCETAQTTPEIAACAAEDLVAADRELNAAYRRALERIKAASHLNTNQRRDWERALREAQRHWLAFRDKDCGEVTGWEWFGGTGMGTASLACKAGKTRVRTEELKARYGDA